MPEVIFSNKLFRTLFLAAISLSAVIISGCASKGATGGATTEVQTPETAAEVENRQPTKEEVMYRVFAGEYLGSEGELQGAVDEYLAAAMQSSDPAIAQRATRIAFAAEAWQEAVMAADRWALLAPESVPAHETAATAMIRVGDYLGAEYQLEKILSILEDSTDAWVLVSRILSQAPDPAQAELVMQALIELRPDAPLGNVSFARSQMAVQQRDLRQAFEYARRAVEQMPDRPDFLAWAGRLALNLDLKDTGIEYVRRAWQLDPDNHDLALGYADLLARNGEAEAARKVMREMPQSPDVMLSRILFELSASNRPAAERLFAEFEASDFGNPDEQAFYLAQSAEALEMRQRAIEYYDRVEGGDRALAASLRRAELISLEGDMETARAALAEIRRQGDAVAVEQSWLTEGRILRDAGLREESLATLDLAVQEMPASVPILYSHSLLAAELGRIEVAEKDLRTIIAAQPDNAAALNALGYTLADQTDRYEEAEALIRQAYQLQPNEASIVDSMGWVSYRLGRLEEAREYLARAWELDRNPEIAAHLGEVLWELGLKDEALQMWSEGAGIDAQNLILVETLQRLGVEL